jgi:hypothetical protein
MRKGCDIKPPADQFDEFAEQLAELKERVDGVLEAEGMSGFDLHRHALKRVDDLPGEGGSEEVSRERQLRIAACTLLDGFLESSQQPQRRSVDDVYERDLLHRLKAFFAAVERTTCNHNEAEIGALVDYAGARVFEGLDAQRTPVNRRVGVTLHLLLTRTRGYPRD